jgi:hypothetical protein
MTKFMEKYSSDYPFSGWSIGYPGKIPIKTWEKHVPHEGFSKNLLIRTGKNIMQASYF